MKTVYASLLPLFAMLMAVRIADGQNIFAPAIDSEDLAEYAAILELSDAQSAAIDSAFGDYRERYAALSEDVRQILPSVTEAWYATEPADDGPDLLRTVRRFQARLSSIEDAFLEQMQPFLTEAQLARVPIVRDRRLRQRHLARIGVTPIGFVIARGGIGIDLRSDLMHGDDGIDRIPEVDALLRAYESRLGAMLQAYDNAYTSCMLTRKPSWRK